MILICVLVAVHEFGHFFAARMNGVHVEAFSIGYGPILFKKTDRKGTEWRFSLIPVGGYVKMFGDADATSVREKIPLGYSEEDLNKMSLHRKKPWQKLIVAFAGPFMNFVFAIFILIGLSSIKGLPVYNNTINVPSENSLAYTSGLRSGDKITKINDKEITNFEQIRDNITSNIGKDISMEISRNNQKIDNIQIKLYNERNEPISTIGISPSGFEYEKISFLRSISTSCLMTWNIARENIKSIFQIFTAKQSVKNVGGVISIFKVSADSMEAGFSNYIWMMAFLSIILGAVNLLPIPVLDGGTVVISAIEWIIRRPLNQKFVETIFMIGLFIVAGLMILGIWNDLSKLKFFIWMENLFK